MFSWKLTFSIFFAYAIIDALYAYYTLKVIERKPLESALAGAVMYGLLAFGIMNYVKNPIYLIPVVLGSFLGTYLVVKYKK